MNKGIRGMAENLGGVCMFPIPRMGLIVGPFVSESIKLVLYLSRPKVRALMIGLLRDPDVPLEAKAKCRMWGIVESLFNSIITPPVPHTFYAELRYLLAKVPEEVARRHFEGDDEEWRDFLSPIGHKARSWPV